MTDSITDTLSDAEVEEAMFEFKQRRYNYLEILFWMALTALFLVRVFYAISIGETSKIIINIYYSDLLLSFFVFMFPVIFLLVFGSLPLESLRRRRYPNLNAAINRQFTIDPKIEAPVEMQRNSSFNVETSRAARLESVAASASASAADSLVYALAHSSKKLADSIYSRSGVYLLVGVMVAFSGLAFFYLQTSAIFNGADLASLLGSLAPKFGILFFIEFVAFFFLKQYRISMDEFRYYEAIKRHREEILVLLRIGHDQNRPVDTFELIKLGQFFSVAGRLQKEESTELLETRKLEKNETAVLEKAIDAIVQIRK